MTDDTNRRVAEACGIEVISSTTVDGTVLVMIGKCECSWFNPMSLAEHAVLAAEKFGLFDPKYVTSLQREDGIWSIFIHDEGGDAMEIGSGTFCSAICQAIIALSKTTPQDS